MSEMSETIFTVRHAETVLGERGLVNGDPGVENPLTPRGIDQAKDVARRLRAIDFALAITTDFPRTKQTADIVLEGRAVLREVIPDLNDPRQGDFEGKDFTLYAEWMDQTGIADPIPGGGESQIDALRRYLRGWQAVVDRASGPVLVIAHAFPISVALTLHDGTPPLLRRNYERDPGFAEINVLDRDRLATGLRQLDEEMRALAN